MNTKQQIAKALLEINAISLNVRKPFIWASGIKSPIYCDNRLILSFPDKREYIIEQFIKTIQAQYSQVDMIIGTSTAGIPWGAIIADRMQLPFGYVRSSNKMHGKNNKIEGSLKANANVIIIEDLISTGGSVKDVILTLQAAAQKVCGVVAIFSYLLQESETLFNDLSIQYTTLSDYDALLALALQENSMQQSDIQKLKEWKNNPKDESWLGEAD